MIQNSFHSIYLNMAMLLNMAFVLAPSSAERTVALHTDSDSTPSVDKTAEYNTYTTFLFHSFLEAYSI